ncbi:ABC transporter ATP-binding protein [Caenimonas soli]|uniref:ABC transporter ATP-binding protein n=1 Tax=Caenimonas soli TaxID=2735555 RepID=UPI00155418F6|nr:ABC transporter ATP-binding protein [Caenimonas soli]NPC57186.1 ABC transporter ATP-binding protein [Caenimonas soli]
MIALEGVSKNYRISSGVRSVLRDVNLTVRRGEKVGVLGRNGSGKSTLLRIVAGTEQPSSGSLTRTMSVSWPLAFTGAFQGALTGKDNLRFVCRIYGVDYEDALIFVEDFTELGRYLNEPMQTYSTGMRARLGFAISMAVDFDCMLIDEVIAVGDSFFHQKCYEELFVRRADRAMIVVSHDPHLVKTYCSTFMVLDRGDLRQFDSVDEAYRYYEASQSAVSTA